VLALRSLLEFLGAGTVAAGSYFLLPLETGDPFWATLLIVPFLVASFRAIERWGLALAGKAERAVGLSTMQKSAGSLEGFVFLLWLVLVLSRHRFGLLLVDHYLAAAGVLLLAHRVRRLLVVLRPCLGSHLPRRPPLVFFLLPLVAYFAVQPWVAEHRPPDGDEPYYLLIAHSLSYDFDIDLANNYAARDASRFMDRDLEPQPGDPRGQHGEIFSRHNMLLPLILALPYRIAGRWGAMVVMAFLSAALAWMVLRLGHFYAPRKPSGGLLAYALFAFSPPMLLYSHQVWVEVPAALLLTLALDRSLALRHGPWRKVDVFALALPVALLPLLKLRFGLVALSLLGLSGWRNRPGRRALVGFFSGLVALAVVILALNQLRFGHPLKINRWSELALGMHAPGEFLRGAVGTFYDSAFGLFAFAPVWLLLLPALVVTLRKRTPSLVDAVVVALPYSLVFWPRIEWFGGWSPPFRYPFVYLPLLALLLMPLLDRRSRGLRVWGGALVVLTLVLTLFWIVLPAWTYNLADGRSDLLDHMSQRFGVDVARFFPSTVRLRTATWLWPVASLGLVPLVLAGRRRRPWFGATGALCGGTVVLVLATALPLLSTALPTRVVEAEDTHHVVLRTLLYPSAWEVERARYHSGRLVKGGGQVVASVVAGGERVRMRVFVRAVGEVGTFEVLAGERFLTGSEVAVGAWQEIDLGVLPWTAGSPLVFRNPADPSAPQGGILVDRIEFEWLR
jgi:hypothetical protein